MKESEEYKSERVCEEDGRNIWGKSDIKEITRENEKIYKKETVEYKVGDRMLLSTKDLVWKMRNRETKKLIKRFVKLYKIKNYIREHDIVESY